MTLGSFWVGSCLCHDVSGAPATTGEMAGKDQVIYEGETGIVSAGDLRVRMDPVPTLIINGWVLFRLGNPFRHGPFLWWWIPAVPLRWHALLVSSHRGKPVEYCGLQRPICDRDFWKWTADPALIDIKNRKSRQAVAFFSTMQQLRPWLCTHSLVPYSSSSGHFQYPATVARDLPILGASVVM